MPCWLSAGLMNLPLNLFCLGYRAQLGGKKTLREHYYYHGFVSAVFALNFLIF